MTIALYMDVHIPQAITTQLRRRNIDILTAQEDHTIELPRRPASRTKYRS